MENLNCGDFDLTEEEIKAISALDRGLRFNDPALVIIFSFLWENADHEMTGDFLYIVPRRHLHLCLNVQVKRTGFYMKKLQMLTCH